MGYPDGRTQEMLSQAFPERIDSERLKKLCSYIATNLRPCRVRYNETSHIDYISDDASVVEDKDIDDVLVTVNEIPGSKTTLEFGYEWNEENKTRFTGFSYNVGAFDLHEISEPEMALIKKVNDITKKFFEHNKE